MASDEQGAGSGTGVAEMPKAAVKPAPPKLEELPPYHVVLHNDDVNDMLDVVEALEEVTRLARERCIELMLSAHLRGLARVLTTHKERAELYQARLQARQLTVTIEPA